MKLAIYNIAVLFVTLTLANVQFDNPKLDRPKFDKSLWARILVGHPGHIYIADKVDGFPFLIDRTVGGIPSWIAIRPPNLLYAVDESSNKVKVYEIDLSSRKATLKAIKEGSSGVVHLQFDANYTRLIGSAYGQGTIDVWNTTNGSLDLIKTIPSQVQPDSNKDRQATPHPHQANLDPTGRFFVINDLGTDSILIIDSKDDNFKVMGTTRISPSGCGPRHGVFYPRKAARATHYIVVCEISNQALVFTVSYGKKRLDLKQIQRISTFGPASPPANATSAAAGAIVLAANNRDLYISNRQTGNLTDSISHFQVKSPNSTSLSLDFTSSASTHGLSPRTISLSKGGQYLLIANQGGGFGFVALEKQANGMLSREPFSALGTPEFSPQFIQAMP